MTDPAQDRTDEYLSGLDAAELWQPEGDNGDGFPIGYDEWNAIRQLTGQPPGTFSEYLEALGHEHQQYQR